MSNPAAAVFAMTLAVWVADVHFAPQPAARTTVATNCQSGPSSSAPADADIEIVVCAPAVR